MVYNVLLYHDSVSLSFRKKASALDDRLRILFVFTDLILPLVLGYYLHQRHIISDRFCNGLIKVNIRLVSTVLALLAFWILPLAPELLWLPLFGFAYVLVPGAIGILCFARRYQDLLDRGAYSMSAMLSNIGTLGGLCAFILFNEAGFAYTQIIGTFQNFLLVLVCFPLAQYYQLKQQAATQKIRLHLDLREMFLTWNQLPLAGMVLGLLFDCSGIARPQLLGDAFQGLVHIGAWSALLPVGYLVDFQRAHHYYRAVRNLIPLRFIIMPAVIYVLMQPFFSDPVLRATMMIVAACPTAINAVLASRLYKLNVDLAVASFLATTALFLLIVFPLLFIYLQTGHVF